MGKVTPRELPDREVEAAEHALLASKVRNVMTRECLRIGEDGQAETAAALAKVVRDLTYDQLLRMRRAILGA